jgi:malate dehydrogenase (oxaloacetate-decarboxylating)(NADP+)
MVALGDADAMVTGVTRNFSVALEDVKRVIDAKPGTGDRPLDLPCPRPHGLRGGYAITEMPSAQELAEIAIERGRGPAARHEPRVALLSFSTFGHPKGERMEKIQDAVKILDGMRPRLRVRRGDGRGRGAQPRSHGALTRSAAYRPAQTCW